MLRPYVPVTGLAPLASGSRVGFAMLPDGGGGGGAETVVTDVSALVSLVAMIPALPADTPVTRPADDTVATAAFRLAHATARPESTTPFASRMTADS